VPGSPQHGAAGRRARPRSRRGSGCATATITAAPDFLSRWPDLEAFGSGSRIESRNMHIRVSGWDYRW
jgi:hypothetical protein